MTTNDSAVLAWHFVGAKLLDGRPIPADGKWLVHEGPVVWCRSGLYASLDPFDALQYARSTNLCRVECADLIHREDDKLVCRRRRIIKRRDATEMLLAFARWSALQVTHLWGAPPVVKRFLETGNDSLRDKARAAAVDSKRIASQYFSRYTALNAVWATVEAAAGPEQRTCVARVARAAADNAAYAVKYASARAAQRAEFNRRVQELFL